MCGVSQGFRLAPLLFINYMNDICNVSHLCTLLYSDDTSMVVNNKNIDKLLDFLNDEMNNLSICMKANKLSLNVNTYITNYTNNYRHLKLFSVLTIKSESHFHKETYHNF